MTEDFKNAAADLRQAKSAEAISLQYLDVIRSFSTTSHMILSSKHSEKIQTRLLQGMEAEIFSLGCDMLYALTSFDPRGKHLNDADFDRLNSLIDASHELLSVRFNANKSKVENQDFKKFQHTVRLVIKNFDEMAKPEFGLTAVNRQKVGILKSKVGAAARTLTSVYYTNQRRHSR